MVGFPAILFIQYFAIAILFFELIYTMWQRPSALQVHMMILLISAIFMFAGYNIEIQATSLAAAQQGAYLSYFGKPFVMMETFMLVSTFFGRKIHRGLYAFFAFVCALFPLMLYTNHYHRLFYSVEAYDPMRKYSPLIVQHGPLYYFYLILSIAFFTGCGIIIIQEFMPKRWSAATVQKKKLTVYTSLAVLSGLVGYLCYSFNITNGYDASMLGILGSVICMLVMFIRFKLFDVIAIAKDHALEDSSLGLIVYGSDGVQSYSNGTAANLLQYAEVRNFLAGMNEGTSEFRFKHSIYSITLKTLFANSTEIGKSIEILDTTYAHNYQELLENEVQKRTERIEKIQKNLIASIADMVETRSLETGDHIRRTSAYTLRIGKLLQQSGLYPDRMTDDYLQMTVLASPLHDIGKISIPDAILLKPGKLTDEEFDRMKQHTVSGSDVIEKSMQGLESDDFIRIASDIAKYHHERWDGTGYPCGIRGEEIPLAARIVALADCFDAMTSDRCYRKAIPVGDVIAFMESKIGVYFDPVLAKLFLDDLKDKAKNGEEILTDQTPPHAIPV